MFSALCDEKVARGEPGLRGLRWSDSHVFFHAGTESHGIVPNIETFPMQSTVSMSSVAVFGHVAIRSGQRPRLWERGHWVKKIGLAA